MGGATKVHRRAMRWQEPGLVTVAPMLLHMLRQVRQVSLRRHLVLADETRGKWHSPCGVTPKAYIRSQEVTSRSPQAIDRGIPIREGSRYNRLGESMTISLCVGL